jgi:hypothetical protein
VQVEAVRGSVSMNFGGQRTSQMIAALVLQFSTLHFCSLEKEKKKEKR